MHFISPELEDYIEQHSERTGLTRCIEQSLPKDSFLHKWSFQGRVLSMLSKLIRPLTLEIGTYTGYSALFM
jgi:predicted O-methyltransferase YrrM